MISDRVFPNGNRFFIQENYSRSRMGKRIIVLDWEIGIFNKLFYVYIVNNFMSCHKFATLICQKMPFSTIR